MASLTMALVAANLVSPYVAGKPEHFFMTTPARVVAYDGRMDFMLFAGFGTERNARVMRPPANLRCADTFRHDTVAIWSEAAGTMWSLLPARLIGRRPNAAPPAKLIEASVINYWVEASAAEPSE